MIIPGSTVTVQTNGFAVNSNTNTFIPLNSSEELQLFPIPNRKTGIPIQNGMGKAIPIKREQTAIPLNATNRIHDIEAEKVKLRKATEGFEAIFIRQLLKTMRSTVSDGNLYGSGSTGEMYADMVESSLADTMAKQGKFGIANTLYNQMVRRIDQEESSRRNSSHSDSLKDSSKDGDR